MRKYFVTLTLLLCSHSWAGLPVFSVTPNVRGQLQLAQGQQGTYIYQITNNTQYNLTNIGLHNLPAGVSYVASAGYQYCTFPLSLNSNSNCLLKINVNSNLASSQVANGPQVCYTPDKPVYCSQPLNSDQLFTKITSGQQPTACQSNITNFNFELTQVFDSTTIDPGTIDSWGPGRNQLLLSSSNPNLSGCTTTDITNTTNINWMQQRALAAEDFWVRQKLNYCHHHVPDFATPLISYGTPRASITSGGGFCSTATNIMPGSFYYGKSVRWNYSGSGSETSYNWINNNYMWYGVDCSDFTSFIYNYAFGIQFNSDTGYQAGQATDGSQDTLTPNGQIISNLLQSFNNSDPNSPAGVLVCKNGQTEQEYPACGGYGTDGYFSVFLGTSDKPTPSNITPTMLTLLKPGDLIYLAFVNGTGNNPTSIVTHVITWTGKKVGYGANDINPSQIAPEDICPNNWQPQVGDWVIIDSHYQGPDYRVFTQCFYQNNIWGVRRVIGYMSAS